MKGPNRADLPVIGPRRGCLANAAGFLLLVAMSPLALVTRWLRARRRGAELRLRRSSTPLETAGGESFKRIDLEIDVPHARREELERRLTDTVVRVAEALRRPDDVYHLVYREAAADETVVMAVGPLLQELGERFHLVLGQASLVGRTAVWIVLPKNRHLAESVDPFGYDPELTGEPEALLGRVGMRWAMASMSGPVGASVLHRLVLYLPRDHESAVSSVLDRLPDR